MSKKKKMDQLSKDSCDALAHNMSYGQYMAWKRDHGLVSKKPIKTVAGEGEGICRCCGKVFTKTNQYRVYCSRQCRATQYDRVYTERTMRGGLGEM